MTDKPKSHSGLDPQPDDLASTSDHFCTPCDVDTMAHRLNIDKRRVQQISKDDPECKNERGEYICPRVMRRYIGTIKDSKRKNASGLVKKQEESLEIRNARDRAEVLAQWEVMVQRKAIIAEYAPAFVALKNNIRKIPSAHCNDIVMFAKRYAQTVSDGTPTPDHELVSQVLKMLGGPIDDSLRACFNNLQAWGGEDKKP